MDQNDQLIFYIDISAFVDNNRHLVGLIPQLYPELDKLLNSRREKSEGLKSLIANY